MHRVIRPEEHRSRADALGPEAGARAVARGGVEGNPEDGCVDARKIGDVRGAHERAHAREPRDHLRVDWPVGRARHYSTRARKRFVRSWFGEEKNVSGGASSMTLPSSIIRIELATLWAKRNSCETTTIVIPSRASPSITSSTSRTSSTSSAEVGSSNSIALGLITRARAIATRCCWPPESSSGY